MRKIIKNYEAMSIEELEKQLQEIEENQKRFLQKNNEEKRRLEQEKKIAMNAFQSECDKVELVMLRKENALLKENRNHEQNKEY